MATVKGDDVFYRSNSSDIVRAAVKTIHRDGSVSVLAKFYIDSDHKDRAGYLGFTFRLNEEDLFLEPPCCLPLKPAFAKAGA